MNDETTTEIETVSQTLEQTKDAAAPAVEAKKPSLARSALAVRTQLRAGAGKADLVNCI